MRHIALFSQTGSEIAALMKNGFIPDQIFYDQTDKDKINSNIWKCDNTVNIIKGKVKDVKFLRKCFGNPKTCFITLPGS